MRDSKNFIKWSTNYLEKMGYLIFYPPIVVVETPWSHVIRILTSKGNVYLKQVPRAISIEPKIIQLLKDKFFATVPKVIVINTDFNGFLMKDAGISLRAYLKNDFQPNLLIQAIKQYTGMQRATEHHIKSFMALGVPDWRLSQLPTLYNNLIKQVDFLNKEGMTEQEILILQNLSSQFTDQCQMLSQYPIMEAFTTPDFNTNNMVYDKNTQKLTCIDLGEAVLTHPFFALHNYLLQAVMHHNIKESDEAYDKLKVAFFEGWEGVATEKELIEVFNLTKKIMPIYSALSTERLINIIGQEAFKSFYAKRPNRIKEFFAEYIKASQND